MCLPLYYSFSYTGDLLFNSFQILFTVIFQYFMYSCRNIFGLTNIGLTPARAFGSYSRLPIKMVGAYGGISDSFDGPSHHSLEDIAVMRTLPNFKVFVASDAV